jgi:hypothetical protein
MKVKVGSLVAVVTTGLYRKHIGNYLFGHVVEIKEVVGSKKIIKHYRVMWDNGNQFLYNDYEMDTYLKNIQDIKNS